MKKLYLLTLCSIILSGCFQKPSKSTIEQLTSIARDIENNNQVLEKQIRHTISNMEETVKRKPDYKALVPAAWAIRTKSTNLIKEIDKAIANMNWEVSEGMIEEKKGSEQALTVRQWRSKWFPQFTQSKQLVIELQREIRQQLQRLSDNRNLGIRQEEINELTEKSALLQIDTSTINFANKRAIENYMTLITLKNKAVTDVIRQINFLESKMGRIRCHNWPMVMSSPEKPYIIKGEVFETQIYLNISCITQMVDIVDVTINGEKIPFKDGIGNYTVKPTKYGEHSYKAEIFVKNPFHGMIETYEKTFKFEVGKRCY